MHAMPKAFHRPMAYDPNAAKRLSFPGNNTKRSLMHELGFDTDNLDDGLGRGGRDEDMNRSEEEEEELHALNFQVHELNRKAEEAKDETLRLKAELEEARAAESRAGQKLLSFQQLNRSQTALVKMELHKSRRRLQHSELIGAFLKRQQDALFAARPDAAEDLPPELRELPQEAEAEEEDEVAEAHEMARLHHSLEVDLRQLEQLVEASVRAGSKEAPPPGVKEKMMELERLVGRQRAELDELHSRLGEEEEKQDEDRDAGEDPNNSARQRKTSKKNARPKGEQEPQKQSPGSEEGEKLRQDLAASQKEAKEYLKKLKQLAQAYQKLDKNRLSLEKQLEAQKREAIAKVPRPSPPATELPWRLQEKVKAFLAAEREQLCQTRASCEAELRRFPQLMEASLQAAAGRLRSQLERRFQEEAGARDEKLREEIRREAAREVKVWEEKYLAEASLRRKLHNQVQELKGNIRVYARVRPLSPAEAEATGSCVAFPAPGEVQIRNDSLGVRKAWQFNEVFDQTASQARVFDGVRDLVVSVMDGFNVCIFAYGQTGSGKTFSMEGRGNGADAGIYSRTFEELFRVAEQRRSDWSYELRASIVEIYNEEIRDLLWEENGEVAPRKKLTVRRDPTTNCNYVPDLTWRAVTTPREVQELLAQGAANRVVGCTAMNERSSRSHLLVQLHADAESPQGKRFSAQMTLVDLAGSERLAKSMALGERAKEATFINKSLSALGDVISSRATKSAHVPYRNSTLTHLLQDSLGGDSKTLMLLQVNPAADSFEETNCSLTFGARVNAVEMQNSGRAEATRRH